MSSRRKFLTGSAGAIAGALATLKSSAAGRTGQPCFTEVVSLCGEWLFRTDPDNQGGENNWPGTDLPSDGWRTVTVPNTWQVEAQLADYRGVAWYRRAFDLPTANRHVSRQECAVRVEFEAVFHTATGWVNGQTAGEHLGKGYTAFTIDITRLLRWGRPSTLAVRVDNAFNKHLLPRARSSDWGGIFRPVQLLFTPATFVERVDVEAVPDLGGQDAKLSITAYVRNTRTASWIGKSSFRIAEEEKSTTILTDSPGKVFSVKAEELKTLTLQTTLEAKLWTFDHPHLYRLEFSTSDGINRHAVTTSFGVRKLEIRDGALHFNGERGRLIGLERMAGSNPEFGMAEPTEWITHDHAEMKHLNCVLTRIHWPQDRRVLDYCNRHGILIQTEVPAWGPVRWHERSA